MKLLVSACLLGDPVRYDGAAKTIGHAGLARLLDEGRVIAFCPEVAGGLPVPRPPAEIQGGDGDAVLAGSARVTTRDGTDVTAHFLDGAQQALELCRRHGVGAALLTESSPSCGSGQVYDGSFSRRAIGGSGVTAALLRRHGIAVFSQHKVDAAIDHVRRADQGTGDASDRH